MGVKTSYAEEAGEIQDWGFFIDGGSTAYSLVGASLVTVRQEYTLWPAEPVKTSYNLQAATLVDTIITYGATWPSESITTGSYSVQAALLETKLIVYTFWPTESIQTGTYSIVGATLV